MLAYCTWWAPHETWPLYSCSTPIIISPPEAFKNKLKRRWSLGILAWGQWLPSREHWEEKWPGAWRWQGRQNGKHRCGQRSRRGSSRFMAPGAGEGGVSRQLAASSAQHGRAVEEREAVHKVTWFNYPTSWPRSWDMPIPGWLRDFSTIWGSGFSVVLGREARSQVLQVGMGAADAEGLEIRPGGPGRGCRATWECSCWDGGLRESLEMEEKRPQKEESGKEPVGEGLIGGVGGRVPWMSGNQGLLNAAHTEPVGSLWGLLFWMRPVAGNHSFTDFWLGRRWSWRMCWTSNGPNCVEILRGYSLLSPNCVRSPCIIQPRGHLAIRNHFSLITGAQIKPKGLKNVTIALMPLCHHSAGQRALAYVTPFCPKLIRCLRTQALCKDHLFTLLLKELHSPVAS